MLRKLISQIREQVSLGKMKHRLRQTKLERIRDRHRRRHPQKPEDSSD